MAGTNLRTIKQIVEIYVWITEPMIRWWIYRKEENGFASVLYRIGGRKWLVDQLALESWIEEQRLVAANDNDDGQVA